MLNFGNIIQSIQGIDAWIQSTVENIGNIFADINFSVLYSALNPSINTLNRLNNITEV